MALTLAEIRAKLQAQDNKQTSGPSDSAVFAHWNIQEGETAKIRFLPDGNDKNSFFWVERSMIRLPFVGVKGQPDSKRVEVQVPCIEMYGKEYNCPILAEVRTWFKDPSLEEMGRKYWKKKSYLFQGFVRENPLTDDSKPESPIRRFTISPQIFNLIRAALMDPEMENLPTDYEAGLDFIVSKTSKGGYADYSTSKWSRKETALSSEELAAIEKYGLFNLGEFLPKKPTDVELKVIKEMFDASVDGKPYDLEAWGSYYKPYGLGNNDQTRSAERTQEAAKPAAKVQPRVVEDDDDEPPFAPAVEEAPEVAEPIQSAKPKAGGNQRAEDILAMIRNRSKVA
jgi:hypothetical protein